MDVVNPDFYKPRGMHEKGQSDGVSGTNEAV